jgi:hypothetical protein
MVCKEDNMGNKYQVRGFFPRPYTFRMTNAQYQKVIDDSIKPEHFRRFVDKFQRGKKNDSPVFQSHDWRSLKDYLNKKPSLQLIGDIGSGKTYITRQLIKYDNSHIYIVLDAHQEYLDLPVVTQISPDIHESCRMMPPAQPAGAVAMFGYYHQFITNSKFPANFVFVVDEALRYKEVGIKNLLAESRKFLKCLAITQEIILETCPRAYVEPWST